MNAVAAKKATTKKPTRSATKAMTTIEPMTHGQALAAFSSVKPFKSESVMVKAFSPHIPLIIEAFYHDKVTRVRGECPLGDKTWLCGRLRPDFLIETARGLRIICELKNPTHTTRENIAGITQLMAYKAVMNDDRLRFLLVTSVFSPVIPEMIKEYKLPFSFGVFDGAKMAVEIH